MRIRRFVEVLALVALCAAVVSLLLRPEKPEAPRPEPGLYTIGGVMPGMHRVDVERILGPGRVLEVREGVETTVYGDYGDADSPELQKRWVTVTWDGEIASRVSGSHLHRDGREVLGRGWKAEEAMALLGAPDSGGSGGFPEFEVSRWSGHALEAYTEGGRLVMFQMEGRP